MRRVERFTLLVPAGDPATWPLDAPLIADGKPTAVRIPGVEILEQFEIIAGYLLVTDHDCPFEETFHVVLLIIACRSGRGAASAPDFPSSPAARSSICRNCRAKTMGISPHT